MSPLTIFLAKFLGLYCIIVALAMMTRKQSAVATIEALIGNPPLLLFVEVIGLAGGLATGGSSFGTQTPEYPARRQAAASTCPHPANAGRFCHRK
jgi:hypothetical protein